MEKVMVTGVAGQLGYDVVKILNERNIPCKGVDIADFDLTDENAVLSAIEEYNPTAVVHCAAYTAVDKAEDNKDAAYAVNVKGCANIAKACKKVGAKLLYVSTDYVFDGEKEGCINADDEKNPLSVYGSTKYQGEIECKKYVDKLFIVRLSWVFGINGGNFVKTMLRLGETKDEISVVNDQFGSPTYTPDAAKLMCDMIVTDKYGEYNVANEGYCSWYEFACAIFKEAGVNIKVNPIPSSEYPTKAHRPKNSCFSKAEIVNAGFEKLPTWQNALERYIKQLKEK